MAALPMPVIVLSMVVALIGGGDASGQSTRPASQPADPAPAGLLAGPTVQEDPDASSSETSRDGRRRAVEIPMRRWASEYRKLSLTVEQRTAARSLFETHQKARRQFEKEHGDELRELRRSIRAAREAGERPSVDVLQRMRALRETGPDPVEMQHGLWALLTIEQQEQFRESLARVRRELEQDGRDRPSDAPPRAADPDRDVEGGDDVDERRLRFLRSRQRTRQD